MKTLISKWNSISLIKRIIAGLIIGVLLAVAVPQASFISILGDLFVGALKAIAPILIFFLVIGSLCRAKTGKKNLLKILMKMGAQTGMKMYVADFSGKLKEAAAENNRTSSRMQFLFALSAFLC